MIGRVVAMEYAALDAALERASRFTLRATTEEERSTATAYARHLILHALNGDHRAYFPVVIDIARHRRGTFTYDPEYKHLVYTALAESMLQLCALTPRTHRPDVRYRGERASDTEDRLCETVAGMYLIAADAIKDRILLRSTTDGTFATRRESLDERLAATNGTHDRFARLLTQEVAALAREYLAARAAAQKDADIANFPFRLIARDPRAHVQCLRATVAYVTGRSVREFAF